MRGNAAIVRRGYEALSRGDLTMLTELFGGDVSWHTPGRRTVAGDVVGNGRQFSPVSAALWLRRAEGREHFYDLQGWGAFWS